MDSTKPASVVVCEVCGKERRLRPHEVGKARFCSRECAGKARSFEHRTAVCKYCGQEFWNRQGHSVFCNQSCYDAYRATKYAPASPNYMDRKTCATCGENKDISAFAKSPTSRDGYYHDCRECKRARNAQRSWKKSGGGTYIPSERRCTLCGEVKPLETGFHRSKLNSLGYNTRCKECALALQREYKRAHAARERLWRGESYRRHREARKEASKRRRDQAQAWWDVYRAGLACDQCGENHPACIDFHHRDPATKLGSISSLVGKGRPVEDILAEIAKCDVLCANCHRKAHWGGKHDRLALAQDAKQAPRVGASVRSPPPRRDFHVATITTLLHPSNR